MKKLQLRHLPNLISITRLLCVPVLGWLAYHGTANTFAWLLLAAGSSDIVDGWLARRFGWTSRMGALLDSLADVLLITVTLYAIWMLHREVVLVHGQIMWAVVGIWLCVHSAALLRYGRLASFHTRFTQAGIALFAAFTLALFFYDFIAWLYYLAGVICFLGGIESLAMIYLLPEWKPNVRGGIVTVLRMQR